MNNTKTKPKNIQNFQKKETFERSTCRLFKASSTKFFLMWKKLQVQHENEANRLSSKPIICIQVGACLGILANLVGMCGEAIKMGYVDFSPPPFKFILETNISCMVYKNV